MVSPAFTINGYVLPNRTRQIVSTGSTVNLALISVVGVATVEWNFHGFFPENIILPTFNKSGSPNGSTSSFTMPLDADGYGLVLGITCIINGGLVSGKISSDAIYKSKVSSPDNTGVIPVGFSGEKMEGNTISGWSGELNRQLTVIRRRLP